MKSPMEFDYVLRPCWAAGYMPRQIAIRSTALTVKLWDTPDSRTHQ